MIDCFIFYNELDLLRYRLHLLNDVVRYFVLVEATHTFTGNKKELFFQKNHKYFKKYLHKIVHIIVDDMPYTEKTTDENLTWKNEHHQRNCIQRGLDIIKPDDNEIVLITDVDEIPDPDVLKKVDPDNVVVANMVMDLYWYNLNRKNLAIEWKHPKLIRYKFLRIHSAQYIRTLRSCKENYKGGWHLSYFGDARFIHNKLNNFSHQEHEVQSINTFDEIKKRMETGNDLYSKDRGWKFTYIQTDQNDYLPPYWKKYLSKYTIKEFSQTIWEKLLILKR